jgi:hypothetical protein
MAVYETKTCGHGPSRKSINKIMAIYETKIADHIIQGPHVQLANPVRKSGPQCGCKSGSQIWCVLPRCNSAPIRWNLPGPQIRFTNLVRNVAANPVRKPDGCYLAEVAPRIADKIHRISPLPNMAIY